MKKVMNEGTLPHYTDYIIDSQLLLLLSGNYNHPFQ